MGAPLRTISVPRLAIVSPAMPTMRFTYSRSGRSSERKTMMLPRTGLRSTAFTAMRSPTAIVGTIESPAVYVRSTAWWAQETVASTPTRSNQTLFGVVTRRG
jgi:hypothetical protein